MSAMDRYEHSRMPEDKIKELVAETLVAVGLKVGSCTTMWSS
ncbi:hypothetical protein HanXRQr2_Chr11g0468991 [Helianthus annuus]|uniref:Uncharacterized protein n=1 Tax=Helianthus annuus TaxID=4232 RepID=A0A9K3HKU5_HELAN|nr:hypothetical protein HanXRQr2_Chr11g0468991 [Helianthus annuus]